MTARRGRQGGLKKPPDLVERNAWWLAHAAPPFTEPAAPEPPAMTPLGEVPLLQPGVRPSW